MHYSYMACLGNAFEECCTCNATCKRDTPAALQRQHCYSLKMAWTATCNALPASAMQHKQPTQQLVTLVPPLVAVKSLAVVLVACAAWHWLTVHCSHVQPRYSNYTFVQCNSGSWLSSA